MGRRVSPDHQNQYGGKRRRLFGSHGKKHRVVLAVPTPSASQHVLHGQVVSAPPQLQRFKEGAITNPVKLDESDLAGGQDEGWDVRIYDPEEFEKSGEGVKHERSFKLAERDEMKKFLSSRISGDVSSRVESSHKMRVYVQKRVRMPDKSLRRVAIDPSGFV